MILKGYFKMTQTFEKKINTRAYNSILNRRKKVEIRAKKSNTSKYATSLMRKGDIIIFTNIDTYDKLRCKIEYVRLYNSIRNLLEIEGTENTLSSTNSIEKGIKSIESIPSYKRHIKINGVYAIKLTNIIACIK